MMDDFVLWLQRLADRAARWARLRVPAAGNGRRFLIVQVDGLSRGVLDRAIRGGHARAIGRLLSSGRLRRRDLSVGIPSSTPAFQAALMYGVRPDIPGFHFYDKREGAERYLPRPGVADLLEARLAAGRRGILEGGACYGCIFTGGAAESLWTFTHLLRPTRAGRALLRAPLSGVVLAWVVAKCVALTVVELTRALLRLVADPLYLGRRQVKWLLFKIGLSIWTRQFFTLAVSAALYRGTPAVYVNYFEYDVFAHAFGPTHALALRALRRVDRSIAQLARIVRRLPECGYDLYILSDHGQAPTRPFDGVSGGLSIEGTVLGALAEARGQAMEAPPGLVQPRRRTGRLRGLGRVGVPGFFQRFLTYLERDFPALLMNGDEPARPEGVRVVVAGPNAFVYFTRSPAPLDAERIEQRYPGAAAALSRHPGIGFILARSSTGPVCWYRGRQVALAPGSLDTPFDNRPDREVVLTGLRELMAMPSAGDLVLYGIGAPGGDVSFLPEVGAHAGPSEAELHTFLLYPPDVELPGAPLTHPIQLYPHFAAYAEPAAR
ncbi:MAG TPA: alkaline phosphatase family protein [Methylomirabilota bacterium]|nr:alkaline phosphatase family protein [Methylomirabilota bacterium]